MTTMRMLILAATECVLLFAGCDMSRAPVELSGAMMRTQGRVVIARPSTDPEVELESLQHDIDAELHGDCLSADARAIALTVLDLEDGDQLARQQEAPPLLFERTDTDLLKLATPVATESGIPKQDVPQAMNVFFCTLVAFALAIAAMAIGVMINHRRLTGSCGGLAGLKDASGRRLCEICSNPSDACRVFDDPRQVFEETSKET